MMIYFVVYVDRISEDELTNDENYDDDYGDSNEMQIFKKEPSYYNDAKDENYANYLQGEISFSRQTWIR